MARERNPSWERVECGRKLAEARENLYFTQGKIALKAGWSRQKLWELETGRGAYKATDLDRLARQYRMSEQERRYLRELAGGARSESWFDAYSDTEPVRMGMLISLETDATEVASYNEELVTGLAQTEAYHRALFDIGDAWEPAVVEQSIAVRKERQARFWGKADVRFTCVMSEPALTH